MTSSTSHTLTSSKVGITLGDPAGIGPEITAKALASLAPDQLSRIVLFGDDFLLMPYWDANAPLPVQFARALHPSGRHLTCADVNPGRPNQATAQAQVEYLQEALALALAGELAGIVTAPISKISAQSAGFAYPGHTEFFCDGLAAASVAMMFAGPKLKVVLATVHEPIERIASVLTAERVTSAIVLAARSMQEDFGIARPHIGVLGLNPHAGEQGRFGDQESRVIIPAIDRASEKLAGSVVLQGPLVPDAAFRMKFDCFVAMYHDQGLIPVKLIDFDESVNTTLGLPIVRTSPDHGVAYDIAGQGIARDTSMRAALHLAFRLVDQHQQQ